MTTISLTLPADGQTIDASDVNTPLNTIASAINGGLDTNNIAPAAGITAAQLNFGGAGSGIWWQEIGRTTLSGAGDTVSITGMTGKKYLRITFTGTGTGLITQTVRFNNDSGTNYTYNVATNGAAASGTTGATAITLTSGDSNDSYLTTLDVINITASEKLIIGNVALGAAGTGSGVSMIQAQCKWVNTSAQITRVDFINTNTGDFAIGAEVVVLGHD